jgi:hypothetical protein
MTSESTGANAGADRENDATVDTTDYGDMLDTLDMAIQEAQRKVESGRVYDVENEKVRIKWIRALAYAVNIRRQVANDRDLEELAEEVEQLKQQQQADGGAGGGLVAGGGD